jgi:hypothetical protein
MRRFTTLLNGAPLAWLSVVALAPLALAQDAPGGAEPVPFIKQFEQQWGPQFRQLHRVELHLMRVACQPTKPQYEKIAADSEPALKEIMRKCAESMQGPRAVGGGLGAGQHMDPRTQLAEAIAKSVRTALSAEQAARYQKELDQRAAARKRVILRNLVAKVDKLLVLTNEQRTQLEAILEKHWNESWNQTQLFMYGGGQFPAFMPEEQIVSILTDAQKSVWRGLPKGNIYFGVNLDFFPGIDVEDEVWDGAPLPAEKKP